MLTDVSVGRSHGRRRQRVPRQIDLVSYFHMKLAWQESNGIRKHPPRARSAMYRDDIKAPDLRTHRTHEWRKEKEKG